MTKLLRTAVLIAAIPALAFARGGGGGHGGGGGARSGGGGMRSGGGSVGRSGGSFGGGVRGGSVGGGFRNGGGFRGSGGFRGNTFVRGGRLGNRFYGGYYPGFYGGFGLGFGYGYPYASYYPYAYDPYYYGAPYYDNGYYDNGYYDTGYYGGNVVYAPQAQYTQPAPPTVINQTIGAPSAGTSPAPFYRAADYYLIAFNDHTIRAALSYIVDGDQIRYTTREHEEKAAPLSSVDVRFSEQINRDRRVEFRLP